MLKKSLAAALAVILLATVSFGHLPPSYDASVRMGREGLPKIGEKGLRAERTYSNKGDWSKEEEYWGSYSQRQGDIVSYGTWPPNDPNGKKLWWWAKFKADSNDVPGNIKEAGTSAWILINSLSASQKGEDLKPADIKNWVGEWIGWNGNLDSREGSGWAVVPTWRDGAQGAYSFTHDDIGSMPFDKAVKPGMDLSKEAGFEHIKQGWGVYVKEMTDADWDGALEMVKFGHEMFNHSMDHTSAADRYFLYNPGDKIPEGDMDVPEEIRGYTVMGAWKLSSHSTKNNWYVNDWENGDVSKDEDLNQLSCSWSGPLRKPWYLDYTCIDTVKAENELMTIYSYPYWEGMSPNDEFGKKSIMKTEINTSNSSAKEITLKASGQKVIIDQGKKLVSVNAVGWIEAADIKKRYPFYESSLTAADQGRPAFILSVFASEGWLTKGDAEMYRNIVESNNVINEKIYGRLGATPYFKNGKQSEYFGYPFDVYSEGTHDYLESKGYVGARGGAKSGVPISSDFFHPYRIDFDAFFIQDNDWNPNSKGGKYVLPNNPHVLLGLNEMVSIISESKGYMIREFHAVADIDSDDGSWAQGSNPEKWKINDPSAGFGGWWGGIAKFQLRAHYEYLKTRITNRQIVVYTPSEAVKYRITANATNKDATLSRNGNTYELGLTTQPIASKYQDEISVIVALEEACGFLAVKYGDGSGTDIAPRRKPVKMDKDGRIWSVSVNPFRSGGKTTLYPDGNWEGVESDIPDPDWTAIQDKKAGLRNSAKMVSFVGIQNGRIALNLTKGNYTAELYNLQGRLIGRTEISAVNGVNATNLRTDNLAKGMFILNVKQAGKLMLNSKIMVK